MQQYEKALDILESIGNKQNIGKTLMRIGYEYFYKGEMDKAEETLMKSVLVLREVGDPQLLWPALHKLGLVYRDTNRKAEAIKNMKEAVDVIEKVRNEIQLPEQSPDIWKINWKFMKICYSCFFRMEIFLRLLNMANDQRHARF